LAGVVGVNVKEEQGGGDSPGGGTTTTTKGGAGGTEVVYVVKASKGMILRKSVEYIRYDAVLSMIHGFTLCYRRYLQQLAVAQGARNRELERELLVYRGSCSNPNGGGTTSDSEASDAAHGSPPAPSGLRYDNREVEHPKIETTR
jgi:hypothetical protein